MWALNNFTDIIQMLKGIVMHPTQEINMAERVLVDIC